MSESKHTPGPWTAVTHTIDGGKREWSDRHIDAGGIAVAAIVTDLDELKASAAANAALIAAAPDLLEALKELYAMVQGECPSLLNEDSVDLQISAAIEKAEGTTQC